VNLDGNDRAHTLYFDSTLQRWRERGTEHLEEDLVSHGPARRKPEPLQPEPEPAGKALEEKTVIDELMTPPRVYSTHVLDLRDRAEKLKSPKRSGAAVPSPVDVHCDDVATEPPNSPIFTEVSEHSDIPESPLEAPALTRSFAATRNEDEQMSFLLPTLTEFSSGIKVYAQACAALERLTFDDAKRQAMIIHSGGVQDLFCALERFQDEDPVQQLPLLELLWSLTFNASALDGLLDDDANGSCWRSLESILRSTKSAGRLQAVVCGILINFTEREALRREICRRGICGLICSALHFHHCSELHEHGCQLLYLLAYYPELRSAVLAAGAVEAAKISDEKWGQWVQEILLC